MWNIEGDVFDPMDGTKILEVATRSLDESDLYKECCLKILMMRQKFYLHLWMF